MRVQIQGGRIHLNSILDDIIYTILVFDSQHSCIARRRIDGREGEVRGREGEVRGREGEVRWGKRQSVLFANKVRSNMPAIQSVLRPMTCCKCSLNLQQSLTKIRCHVPSWFQFIIPQATTSI